MPNTYVRNPLGQGLLHRLPGCGRHTYVDYSILATQAALKRIGQPHGGPELYITIACVVAQKLSALGNKDKVLDLEDLKKIDQIASYFIVGSEAYRTNNHRCRNRSNEIVRLTGIVSNAFRRLVFTLGLGYLSLRLRWCGMPMVRTEIAGEVHCCTSAIRHK